MEGNEVGFIIVKNNNSFTGSWGWVYLNLLLQLKW